MTARYLIAALVSTALLPASASAATNGQLANTCAPAGQPVQTLCYGGDVLVRDGQAYAQPGRFEPALQQYEKSWTHRTLALQYELGNDVGFVNAPWLGTHNSFNSIAQLGPAVSTTDANQQLTMVDQLRMDMRSLEVDVHWFPSARAGGQNAPVVCHAGAVSENDGCSTEPLLAPVLDQIGTWLRANRDQVLLLYIEDHLSGGGYPSAVSAIKSSLGSLVYGTGSANGGCVEVPSQLTRNDVLKAGAQVIIVANSGCGEGADWRSLVFSWRNHAEEGPDGFKGFPDCGPNFKRSDYDSKLIRYFEDSTWLTAGAGAAAGDTGGDGLSPDVVSEMVRCGVDLFGFDQLQPGDGRNEAAVWSFAPGQPSKPNACVELRDDGRWYSVSCKKKRLVACKTGDGGWRISKQPLPAASIEETCASQGLVTDVPRTGYSNELLRIAAGGKKAWIPLSQQRPNS